MLQNVNQNIPYILCKKIDENGINNQLNYKSDLQKKLSLKNYDKQYILIQTFSVLDINKKTDALNENDNYYKTDTQNYTDMLNINILVSRKYNYIRKYIKMYILIMNFTLFFSVK